MPIVFQSSDNTSISKKCGATFCFVLPYSYWTSTRNAKQSIFLRVNTQILFPHFYVLLILKETKYELYSQNNTDIQKYPDIDNICLLQQNH